ncbi:protein kinase regulatory subunit ATG17 NDAI_0J02550 [Naumovozyma dairenensis CBS 421]|uniref:Autophagy-related protein 17 n=1 Tax=Naumovozyma dairenensis (strain ATCC 10597 / BCRC 20456 / CBS 421 / NBRC 0211 / NRRL Y-12639) TaxID=1071378 RepID=G0WH69_NAUDC|nr:hypothetical protein NDAI_0J02550 [Naumovozyma dairenensis CBS 421]CCD27147.1 hypothetical protein NDAI_0J02550 [Naumovozyma dairenensis CBS 421]
MIMKEVDVKILVEHARKTLVEAQILCQETNLQIFEYENELDRWQQSCGKLKFIIDCLKQQVGFLYHCILEKSIEKNLIHNEWEKFILVDLVEEMTLWQNRISKQIEKLDDLDNVLLFKGNEKNQEEEEEEEEPGSESVQKLGDYVSRENIFILKERLQEIPTIQRQIENIRSQYTKMYVKVKDNLIDSKLKDLEKEYQNKLNIQDKQVFELTNISPQVLKSFEIELVDFLSSLTDHFDKCQLLESYVTGQNKLDTNPDGKPDETRDRVGDDLTVDELEEKKKDISAPNDLSKSETDADYEMLLEIVTKDNNDLEFVLKTLNETIELGTSRLSSYKELLSEKIGMKDELHNQVKKLIEEVLKYQEYLMIFKDISDLLTTFKEGCMDDIRVVEDLCEFYTNFEKSYQNLLKEVERRKQVRNKMEIILNECDNKLQKLNSRDQKMREIFLNENGNFLPENIWPNKIDDFKPLYHLDYSLEDV